MPAFTLDQEVLQGRDSAGTAVGLGVLWVPAPYPDLTGSTYEYPPGF